MAPKITEEKRQAITSIKESVSQSATTLFADYRGLNVKSVTSLRRKLRQSNSQMHVYKNTFVRIALKDLGIDLSDDFIKGPTAVITVDGDASVVAKLLVDFIKENNNGALKGGILEQKLIDESAVKALSQLPSRQELIAKVVGTIKAPLNHLVLNLSSPVRGLVYVLQSIKDQKN